MIFIRLMAQPRSRNWRGAAIIIKVYQLHSSVRRLPGPRLAYVIAGCAAIRVSSPISLSIYCNVKSEFANASELAISSRYDAVVSAGYRSRRATRSAERERTACTFVGTCWYARRGWRICGDSRRTLLEPVDDSRSTVPGGPE